MKKEFDRTRKRIVQQESQDFQQFAKQNGLHLDHLTMNYLKACMSMVFTEGWYGPLDSALAKESE